MKVRISFRSEVVIEGETMEQVRKEWELLPLYSDEAYSHGAGFLEIDAVEDAETFSDLMRKFCDGYES